MIKPEFIARISAQIGADFPAFEESLHQSPPISIRFNHAKKPEGKPTHLADLLSDTVPWHPDGQYLSARPSFTGDPLFHAGAYYVQEASSMVVYQMLEPEKYDTLLDLCAAPGGKSTLLASAKKDSALLISNEVIRARAGILAENMMKWGTANVIVTQNDAVDFQRYEGYFDCILVDAPCSGEGMFRKEPHSQEEWSEENVRMCAARQMRIVADIIPALAAGGHLIYATCTFSENENEALIQQVLTAFPDMELSPVLLSPDFGFVPSTIAGVSHAAYRAYPHKVKGEGFFICRLRKKGVKPQTDASTGSHIQPTTKNKEKKASPLPISIEKVMAFLHKEAQATQVEQGNAYLFYYPERVKQALKDLSKLHFVKKGVLIGEIKGKDFHPAHELALSLSVNAELPRYEMDKALALQFLLKNDLPNDSEYTQGWLLACHHNIPLGWLKAAGNRLKNHLPIHLRIRNL